MIVLCLMKPRQFLWELTKTAKSKKTQFSPAPTNSAAKTPKGHQRHPSEQQLDHDSPLQKKRQ